MTLSNVDKTLADRGARYGALMDNACTSQALKSVMRCSANWHKLAPDQQEALEMIAHKVARALHGDPNYHDSWHDIAGYAQLVANRLLTGQMSE